MEGFSKLIFGWSLIITLFFVAVSILYWYKSKKIKYLEFSSKINNKILTIIGSDNNLDRSLAELLVLLSTFIEAPSYALYLLDSKSNKYILKSVRQMFNEITQIGPSYSGLLPYHKETYIMPATLILDKVSLKTELIKEGEVPVIIMPINGNKANILIGPVKYVSKRQIKYLEVYREAIQCTFDGLLQNEELKKQIKFVTTSGKAIKNISNMFTETSSMLDMVMGICINTINAKGGLFIRNDGNMIRVDSSIGLGKEAEELIRTDKDALVTLCRMAKTNNFVSVTKKDKEFYSIPPYFIAEEIEELLIMDVKTDNEVDIIVFCYDNNPTIKEYQITALQIMAKRMSDIINNHAKFKELSNSYIEILKMLAKLLDNLRPSTIGYSELMYRYAIIISKELKLGDSVCKDVALAAYLSNIGIIGLSDELLNKRGKFTELEYEMMKLHSEAGASMVEATIGNKNVASYIRYHHERMDGFGYPIGFKGDEIPIGARIIAVLQTFLAKIIAREYRPAVPFDKAMEQIKSASDTQLDSNVVQALINWYARKQRENRDINRTLGRCWEMRCAPDGICSGCPAYKNNLKNCWEFMCNNCVLHGNNCETCFIRTEYLARARKVV